METLFALSLNEEEDKEEEEVEVISLCREEFSPQIKTSPSSVTQAVC
jgi:hypothetical protein